MIRLAVDTGGTFTDVVYIDDRMRLIIDKVSTTPRDLSRGVLESIKKIQINLSEVSLFIHGTTAGLNTVAQRTGAIVGLITTKGFIDILEMTRSSRKEVYNYLWKKPRPLVPRYLRLGIDERTNFKGEIQKGVDEREVAEIVRALKEHGVEAVAACLLHSYANPDNELKLGEIFGRLWQDIDVFLSHRVAREIGENRRTNTTVISAYMGKAVAGYIDRLNEQLKTQGFNGQLLILGPGGLLGIEAAREKPLFSLASGPVGGSAGAAHLAGFCGMKDVITMDVGGTSFDISLIKDGQNTASHDTELMGYPIMMAGIKISSIGAGGGSIARVDEAGLLTVGPESAGADPGPMAYGLGGTEPTVTDAALVNGLIDPGYFLGGGVKLDMEQAEKGVRAIAEKLGLSLPEAAEGILVVARNNMTTATAEILIGRGHDPRDFAIMAFGGGGGLFAGSIARDMSVSKVVIPRNPGVFSARGILTMNLVHTYARAYSRRMTEMDVTELTSIFIEMENSAIKTLALEGILGDRIDFNRTLDIAYEGQVYNIETPIPGGELSEQSRLVISESFENLHVKKYGHRIDAPLVVTTMRLKATGRIDNPPEIKIAQNDTIPSDALKKPRKVYLDGAFAEVRVYERDRLLGGNTISGPAIVEEPFHTTVILPGQVVRVDKLGNLVISTGSE